jgi:hypothetical protein
MMMFTLRLHAKFFYCYYFRAEVNSARLLTSSTSTEQVTGGGGRVFRAYEWFCFLAGHSVLI